MFVAENTDEPSEGESAMELGRTGASNSRVGLWRRRMAVRLGSTLEAADECGRTVDDYEVAGLVWMASSVHDAPGIHGSGPHLGVLVLGIARECVQQSALGLDLFRRYYTDTVSGKIARVQCP